MFLFRIKTILLKIAFSLHTRKVSKCIPVGKLIFSLLNKIIIYCCSYSNSVMLSKTDDTCGQWSMFYKNKHCPFKPQLKLNTWTYYSMMWVMLISLFMAWVQMCEVYPYKEGKNQYVSFLVVHLELVETRCLRAKKLVIFYCSTDWWALLPYIHKLPILSDGFLKQFLLFYKIPTLLLR